MSIRPLTSIEGIPAALALPAPTAGSGASSFADTLLRMVDSVDHAQLTADHEAKKLALGGGNLHETALSLEEADISMRLLMKGRNKAVEAYQEVMRMQF